MGKIERDERDFVWMWLFDLFTVAKRGQRVGQVNRHVPCVLVKVDARMLKRVKAYRERIFQRANLDESRGMAIGRTNITYGGGGSDVERIVGRKYDARSKNGGYGPDSYTELNDGNVAESVVQRWRRYGSLEKAQARADAVENMKDQLWEDTLEQALAKNPDGDIDVLRAEFERKSSLTRPSLTMMSRKLRTMKLRSWSRRLRLPKPLWTVRSMRSRKR